MAFVGFVVAIYLFWHFRRHLRTAVKNAGRPEAREDRHGCGGVSWRETWQREWAEKFQKQAAGRHWHRHAERWRRNAEREAQRWQRRAAREARRWGIDVDPKDWPWACWGTPGRREAAAAPAPAEAPPTSEDEVLRRARRRAAAEAGFYAHLMAYLGTIALLALINLFTTWYPWFLWPALGWGFGLFSHYMAVFGRRMIKERYFDPAVEREVRREKADMTAEKQASIDELSSTLAHEIRNPIAAAKSLVQQMGEDPQSIENVEYAKVAIEELDRVERSISHLLRYAKEEDYTFAPVNVAHVVDAALTELRAKLDAAKVSVARNYIAGPTIVADREKLRRVFANILDNAIDAFAGRDGEHRIDVFVENGKGGATVRIRDNGCGIPADRIDRIFNPFFTTKEKGTGLGMAICKKIVEAHEGTIDVVSEAGRGAEFVVSLPTPS
ncbi:MAG TPA: HAMP domain-containing sensor histidine kinase [Candidatus Binatia bacterium]|nr:HAMP domain-containing sensor histidine kinase [Candidatus Binatia bacterium]